MNNQGRQYSKYQLDIFENIKSGKGNTHIDAYAGSGKTTTIVDGLAYTPKTAKVLMTAFNASTRDTLVSRVPKGIDVKTLHGLGYSSCLKNIKGLGKLNDKKLPMTIESLFGNDYDYYSEQLQLIPLAKGHLASTVDDLSSIADRFDISIHDKHRDMFFNHSLTLLNALKKDKSMIDFDDMIWFPVVYDLPVVSYHRIFVDEVQDLNLCQIRLVYKAMGKNSRVMTVGDQYQSIYQFRGAAQDAIDNVVRELKSIRLPLSVTYRCARSIVAEAQHYVPDIQAAPNAIDGFVENIDRNKMYDKIQPGDFVLSRTNAPLIQICLQLIRKNIPAQIQGKDIASSFVSLVKKSKMKDIYSFLTWIKEYYDTEIARLKAVGRDSSICNDKLDCFIELSSGLADTNALINRINDLFSETDSNKVVTLSTTHKAKGMERDRVFMLKKTYRPSFSDEERNLAYVAVTRARKELYYVTDL